MRRVVPLPFPDDPLLTDPKMFGVAVRAARTQSGLSVQDAALAVGVAKQTLLDVESGRPSVGFGLALKIAQALGVAVFIRPASDREQARRRLSAAAKTDDAT